MKKVLIIVVLWLVLINVFALVTINRLNVLPDTALNDLDRSDIAQSSGWSVAYLHPHWDEYWYASIAEFGYFGGNERLHSSAAFFPLYPMMMAGLGTLVGGVITAGVFISMVFLVLSAALLYVLVKEFHSEAAPVRAVMMLLLFPTAFFLNSVYTESLFLFFSLATFYFLFKKNFWIAGLFGFLAALTRSTGILLMLPFAWELWQTYKGRVWRMESVPLLALPLAPLLYFTYLEIRFGNFFKFFDAQAEWGRNFSFNFSHFSFEGTNAVTTSLDIAFAICGIVASVYVLKKIKVSYGIYMLAVLLVALASGSVISMGRILLTLFPLFILAASLKSETTRFAWLLPSTLLLGLYTLLFVNGYWAG